MNGVDLSGVRGPHAHQPVIAKGTPLGAGRAAMIMLHGRNAGPANILELGDLLGHPDFTFLAPSAAGGTWYPLSFLSDVSRNEPSLSSALELVDRLVAEIATRLPRKRIMLLGFSQGACLALEYVVRAAARGAPACGGVIGLSGGLIGPPGTVWEVERGEHPGNLAGMPVLLACSDVDPHIPKTRVEESAAVLERMGARVILRMYPGMGHQVNEDEISLARGIMKEVAATS